MVIVRNVLLALCSTLLSLLVAEQAAGLVRRHAFPYLNIFQADARYGVTLIPGADTRIRSRTGRLTDIHVNSAGFRGPERTPSSAVVPGRVMLLGDSQVFGYGVAYEDSLAAQLNVPLQGMAVAVPTWGPTESVLALEDLLPVYRPEHVVFVANVANDWFETTVPNHRRNTARDGWTTRHTDTPTSTTEFPGRAWLFGRSHLFFAMRELVSTVREPAVPPADAALRVLRELPQLSRPEGPYLSRVSRHVAASAALCARQGCTLSLVVLPMDVQVHPDEWRKYRSKPVDLTPVANLAEDLLIDARNLGVRGLDLLPTLVDASPGAFLPDDYHLSPRGHAAVARAVARLLDERVAGALP
ncbi:MAG: hypothetical protein AB2A00_14185 [Myxococcota bacterium]